MRPGYAWVAVLASLVAAVLAHSSVAADKTLEKRLVGALPNSKDISGWTAVPRSRVYGEGKGLTEIYNGGYRQYLDNGVVGAARQVYEKSGMTAELVLHRMLSLASAAKLAKIKRAEFPPASVAALRTLPKGWSGFAVQDSGYAASYVYSARYLASVVIAGRQANSSPATGMASKAVSKALAADRAARKTK